MTEAGTQTPEITTPAYLQDYSRVADEIRSFVKNPDALPFRKDDLVGLLGRLKHDWAIIVKLRAELEEKGLTFARVNGDSQISFFEHGTLPPYTIETTTLHRPLPFTESMAQVDFSSYGHANPTNLREVRIAAPIPSPGDANYKTIESVASVLISDDGEQAKLSYSQTESQERIVQLRKSPVDTKNNKFTHIC